jgi:polysaccharide pyruvyl transferase WcaK-like protein
VQRALLIAPRNSSAFGDEARSAAFRASLVGINVANALALPSAGAVGRMGSLLDAVEQSDAVVFAGGALLHVGLARAEAYSGIAPAAALCAYARARGKIVAAVGVTVGLLPRGRDRALARSLVRHSSLLVLRDDESGRSLKAIGAPAPFRIGSDPCWMLVDKPNDERSRGNHIIAALDDHPVDVRGLAHALDECRREGFEVWLMPCRPRDSRRSGPIERIASWTHTGSHIADPVSDLSTLRLTCRGAAAVVTNSVASTVAAASAGSPVIPLEGEPGVDALARRLNANVAPSHRQSLGHVIAAAARRPSISPALMRAEIAYAEEGFRLLRVLLLHGRTPEATELHGLPLGPIGW